MSNHLHDDEGDAASSCRIAPTIHHKNVMPERERNQPSFIMSLGPSFWERAHRVPSPQDGGHLGADDLRKGGTTGTIRR